MWDGGKESVYTVLTEVCDVEKKFERFCQSHVFHRICFRLFAFGWIMFRMSLDVCIYVLGQVVLVYEFLKVDVRIVCQEEGYSRYEEFVFEIFVLKPAA